MVCQWWILGIASTSTSTKSPAAFLVCFSVVVVFHLVVVVGVLVVVVDSRILGVLVVVLDVIHETIVVVSCAWWCGVSRCQRGRRKLGIIGEEENMSSPIVSKQFHFLGHKIIRHLPPTEIRIGAPLFLLLLLITEKVDKAD